MAGGDLSKTFSELESDDVSLETSVPTDFTFSPSTGSEDIAGSKNRARNQSESIVTKQLLERKKLLHDMQVLKIELSQKTMLLDNQKSQYQQRMEELEEQLNDTLHEKHILQVKLESELKIQEDDSRRRTASIKKELEELTTKQKKLEFTNKQLAEKADCVRGELNDISISENCYYDLRSRNESTLSLRDFLRIKFYEALQPLKTEIMQLKSVNRTYEEANANISEKFSRLQLEFENEKRQHGDLRVNYQKTVMSLTDTKEKVKVDDYKLENYDKIKSERDNLESDLLDKTRQLATFEVSLRNLEKEREDLNRELLSTKQSLSLIKQDKDYLSKNLTDTQNRSAFSDERLQQLTRQMDEAKASRDELYEKYIVSREMYKSEYEVKLKDELEQMRVQTSAEIEELRTTSREMYERENRNLREARDMALSEKDRAQQDEKDMCEKYERLLNDFRKVQSENECHISESSSQLKLKAFECERTQMVYEESVQNNKQNLLEVEKLQKKIEVLTKEFYVMQSSYDKKVAELESQASEKNSRLESYEKLEKELDDVVLQAAEVETEEEAEKVLFSYGYGANVPSNAKRRLKQSVHLAQRVLSLERTNSGLQKELETEKDRAKDLMQDLQNANDLLGQAQQPYNFLIDSIRVRDFEINKSKDETSSLNKRISRLERENKELTQIKNQMSLDIEKLLNQKQELALMKKAILGLKSQPGLLKDMECDVKDASTAAVLEKALKVHDIGEASQPSPTLFTKEVSNWRRKLSEKNSKVKSVTDM